MEGALCALLPHPAHTSLRRRSVTIPHRLTGVPSGRLPHPTHSNFYRRSVTIPLVSRAPAGASSARLGYSRHSKPWHVHVAGRSRRVLDLEVAGAGEAATRADWVPLWRSLPTPTCTVVSLTPLHMRVTPVSGTSQNTTGTRWYIIPHANLLNVKPLYRRGFRERETRVRDTYTLTDTCTDVPRPLSPTLPSEGATSTDEYPRRPSTSRRTCSRPGQTPRRPWSQHPSGRGRPGRVPAGGSCTDNVGTCVGT